MSPFRDILGPLSRYDHPWKKKKKTKKINTHPWFVFWQKKTKFHISVDRGLKLLQYGSLIRWIWWCDFRKDHMTFKGCFLLFSETRKFSQALNFWWVSLILMKLTCLKSALKCGSFDVTIGIKIPFFSVSVTIEPGRSLLQFVTTNCVIMERQCGLRHY